MAVSVHRPMLTRLPPLPLGSTVASDPWNQVVTSPWPVSGRVSPVTAMAVTVTPPTRTRPCAEKSLKRCIRRVILNRRVHLCFFSRHDLHNIMLDHFESPFDDDCDEHTDCTDSDVQVELAYAAVAGLAKYYLTKYLYGTTIEDTAEVEVTESWRQVSPTQHSSSDSQDC